jgi:hypothetical protein
MPSKLIAVEKQKGPFQMILQRVMRMVPDKDKNDQRLWRLIAFRLKTDGEAATSEFLVRNIRNAIKCAYTGSFYEFLKDNIHGDACRHSINSPSPPGAA